MRRFFQGIFLFLISQIAILAHADIKEAASMSEPFSILAQGDVLVFDIDNTILEPVQTLGSDQWYGYRVEHYKRLGLDENVAIDAAISDWLKVQNRTQVRAAEPITPSLIRSAQQRGLFVLALTARPKEVKDATLKQLSSIGVQFRNMGTPFGGGAVELYNGVLFVGPKNNKGRVLAQYLESLNLVPSRLIFVDDKQKHVANMDKEFLNSGIPNINFRYGALDDRVKSFSPRIADIQWEYFLRSGILLTDKEAEKLSENPK